MRFGERSVWFGFDSVLSVWDRYMFGQSGLSENVTYLWDVYLHCDDKHDDVIIWKHFPGYWAICEGKSSITGGFHSQRSVTQSFDDSLMCAWTNGSANSRHAGDLRHHGVHCDVNVMETLQHQDPSFARIPPLIVPYVIISRRCVDVIQTIVYPGNHAHASCSVVAWWRHQMEALSALLTICAGNSPVTGEFHAQRPVTRSFDALFDLRLNKRRGLSKQWWGWWFETHSYPLWRHCSVLFWIGPYSDVTMNILASQITGDSIVCLTVGWDINENIKGRVACPLWGESTGDRWIPHTKGKSYRNCFHLMTSSYAAHWYAELRWYQSPVALPDKTYFRKISWSLMAVRLEVKIIASLWKIWQAPRQQCCRRACHISERS